MFVRVRAVAGAFPLGAVLAAIGVTAGLAVGLLQLDRLPFSVCVFKAVTGWPCLTCGTTRALALLFARDVPAAFAMNPLATLLAGALLPWGVADGLLMLRGRALGVELAPWVGRVARAAAVPLLLGQWAYLVAAGR
jgi:hypothetical protein